MTEPLTPVDCDLSDFAFMPLDVARLRDSELASNETPEACWAAVLLWAASWHQMPAASIPNDDKWIAKQAGYALRGKIDKAWNTIRTGALRGWVECSDGRLYHPVVAEKAREAWQAKLKQRWGTECARIKKHNDRHETDVPKPTFEEWLAQGCPQGQPLFVSRDKPPSPADVPEETPSKGQGEGQRQGEGEVNSVANATAADAAASEKEKPKSPEEMAKAELWRAAVAVLQEGGCKSEDVCRSFMGKLVKDYTVEIVRDAVSAAASNQPADAREYLKATCMRMKGERAADHGKPLTVPSAAAEQTARLLAEQAAHAAEVERQRLARKAAKEAESA